MASLETLLSSVRSDTPTSFFLVVSKVAFLGFGADDAPGCAALAALSLARRVTPYNDGVVSLGESIEGHGHRTMIRDVAVVGEGCGLVAHGS